MEARPYAFMCNEWVDKMGSSCLFVVLLYFSILARDKHNNKLLALDSVCKYYVSVCRTAVKWHSPASLQSFFPSSSSYLFATVNVNQYLCKIEYVSKWSKLFVKMESHLIWRRKECVCSRVAELQEKNRNNF